jgi:hypothetical protein
VKLEHSDAGPALGHVDELVLGDDGVVYAFVTPVAAQDLPAGTPTLDAAVLGANRDGRGSYPWRSIEVVRYDQTWDGKPRELIGAVALLGAARPAAKGPAQATIARLTEDADMQEKTQTTQESLEQEVLRLKEALAKAEEERKRLEAEAAERATRLEAAEKALRQLQEEAVRSRAQAWRSERIAQGRWMPLFDELKVVERYAEVQLGGTDRERALWDLAERLMDALSKAGPVEGKRVQVATDLTPASVQAMVEQFRRERMPNASFAEALIAFGREHPELEPYLIYGGTQ